MNKKMLGKLTLMAVVVSVLALGGTAEASGLRGTMRVQGVFEQARQWLAKLWPWVGGDQEKYGVGIDPNGQPAPPPPSQYGGGIDPDGAEIPDGRN
ncbi:MAG TPA: hypothetical protein VLE27_02160 [Thermoanaerobaculia bacterium]|nr:hypothetical protein [Thermoanaerobaculia bacterium]